MAAIVALRLGKVEIDQSLLAQLLGIGTPTLVALLALLRGIGNSQEIKQAHSDVTAKLDQNTRLTVETKQAVESGT